jgi:hypothetical protein
MDTLTYTNLCDTDKIHYNSLNNLYKGYIIQYMNRGYNYTDSYIKALEYIIIINLPTLEIYIEENT